MRGEGRWVGDGDEGVRGANDGFVNGNQWVVADTREFVERNDEFVNRNEWVVAGTREFVERTMSS